MQNYTSKNTSINSTKLPALFNKLNYEYLVNNKTFCIDDYGCGKYWKNIETHVNNQGILYLGYDPYWRSDTKDLMDTTAPHLVFTCSNVLNVIDDDDVVRDICRIAAKHHHFAITVYEGDKSGVGKVSKTDCYQRNAKLNDYLKYFPETAYPFVYKNVITNDKNLIR